jgi:hypothetical protein
LRAHKTASDAIKQALGTAVDAITSLEARVISGADDFGKWSMNRSSLATVTNSALETASKELTMLAATANEWNSASASSRPAS